MSRYKLPDVLGGGECVFHSKGYQDGCWIVELVDTMPGMRLELESSALTEVEPPLPDEPPVGSFVAAGTNGNLLPLYRRWREGWMAVESLEDATWPEICAESQERAGRSPVRLVPAPEPVELPWTGSDADGDDDGRKIHVDCMLGLTLIRVVSGQDAIGIALDVAGLRELARAVTTAADALDAAEVAS
jgi:hypothetical protein